jgi:hypothetical protein
MEIQKKVFWNFFFFGGKAWKFIEGGATRGFFKFSGGNDGYFYDTYATTNKC